MTKKISLLAIVILTLALAAAAVGAQDNGRGGPGGRGGPNGMDDRRFGGIREIAAIIEEETGLTGRELLLQVREGKTIAEVITENGGDVEAVVDATVTSLTERINTAVAEGRMTQERADTMLAQVETTVNDLVNGTFELGQNGGMMGGGLGRGGRVLITQVAEAAGAEPVDVLQQVRDGATLASILTDAGVDVETFVEAQLADAKVRLDEQVAAGRISQAVADARLNLMEVELLDALNRVHTPAAEATAQPGA